MLTNLKRLTFHPLARKGAQMSYSKHEALEVASQIIRKSGHTPSGFYVYDEDCLSLWSTEMLDASDIHAQDGLMCVDGEWVKPEITVKVYLQTRHILWNGLEILSEYDNLHGA